jgi:hypothetical protein
MEKPRRRPPKKAENPEDKIARAWRDVWESPQGRVAISALLLDLNLFSPIEATDPVSVGIAVGQRNVAAKIARLIKMKPEQFPDEAGDAVQVVERFIDQQPAAGGRFEFPF